jgi:hypothetical protein
MRERLRILDCCLSELETALERDEVVLSPVLAARLASVVGGLAPGIAITAAQEVVFREQEICLAGRNLPIGENPTQSPDQDARLASEGTAQSHESKRNLTRSEARRISERIRAGAQNLCELVFEAHRGRAWVALGYPSWEDYVREEFNLSRSSSYELVDQGRALTALSAAANVPLRAVISPYAVREIKRYIPQLAAQIRARVSAGASDEEAREIVIQAVRDKRRIVAENRDVRASRNAGPRSRTFSKVLQGDHRSGDALTDVILYLASLPPPSLILRRVNGDVSYDNAQVSRALSWLTQFAEEIGTVRLSAPARRAG